MSLVPRQIQIDPTHPPANGEITTEIPHYLPPVLLAYRLLLFRKALPKAAPVGPAIVAESCGLPASIVTPPPGTATFITSFAAFTATYAYPSSSNAKSSTANSPAIVVAAPAAPRSTLMGTRFNVSKFEFVRKGVEPRTRRPLTPAASAAPGFGSAAAHGAAPRVSEQDVLRSARKEGGSVEEDGGGKIGDLAHGGAPFPFFPRAAVKNPPRTQTTSPVLG
ncbi:MAG: hypothetical protein Q9210_007148 [Variospora velana]